MLSVANHHASLIKEFLRISLQFTNEIIDLHEWYTPINTVNVLAINTTPQNLILCTYLHHNTNLLRTIHVAQNMNSTYAGTHMHTHTCMYDAVLGLLSSVFLEVVK